MAVKNQIVQNWMIRTGKTSSVAELCIHTFISADPMLIDLNCIEVILSKKVTTELFLSIKEV